jgi:Ca2+-binding RTX toxin-like protein
MKIEMTRGQRLAGVAVAAIAAAGSLAIATPVAAATAPARPVDRDIHSYVLLGLHGLSWKGANGPGQSSISGGDVGVNDVTGRLTLCPGLGHGLVMDDGSQVVANAATLGSSCSLSDVYVNQLSGTPGVRGAISSVTPVNSSQTILDDTAFPAAPTTSCSSDRPVTSSTQMPLAAGSYGDVTGVHNLVLGAGSYTFCSIDAGALTADASTVVNVVGDVAFSSRFDGPCDTQFSIGGGSVYGLSSGQVWAPNATITFAINSTATGRFWAGTIGSDFNVSVTGCGHVSPPPPPPVMCDGKVATIVGTPGNDIIHGTKGNDVIAGLGGNDVIFGNRGDDVICGGDGNDVIFGDAGNDRLFGDAGNDHLFGASGTNQLDGGPGSDHCLGGRHDGRVACE